MIAADRAERGELALVRPELEHPFALLLRGALDRFNRIGRIDLAPPFEAVRPENKEAEGGHVQQLSEFVEGKERLRIPRVPKKGEGIFWRARAH